MRNLDKVLREPSTKQELVNFQACLHQIRALAPDYFRVTLMHASVGKTYVAGNHAGPQGPDGNPTERFFQVGDIQTLVPHLVRENRRAYNIFITLFHADWWYIVLDDILPETIQKLEAAGLTPRMMIESSRSRFQGIYCVPKDDATAAEANEAFKLLNRRYGDPKIVGLNHPFRAAGFGNSKLKHRNEVGHYPFVRVEFTHDGASPGMGAILEEAREILTKKKKTKRMMVKANRVANRPPDTAVVVLEATSLKVAREHYVHAHQNFGKTFIAHRADWMVVRSLAARGVSDTEIEVVLMQESPNLLSRFGGSFKKAERYVRRTVVRYRMFLEGELK